MRVAALIAIAALGTVASRLRRLLAAGPDDGHDHRRVQGAACGRSAPPPPAPAPAATGGVLSVADVVARVLPGVVNVKTKGFDGDEGEGSGVVIDRRGVIVTNNHVVRGARTLTVSFNDGRHTKSARGEVIGTAAERDLAIIRVRLDDLIPIPLGRSSKLRLGDGVIAIGFPLGLGRRSDRDPGDRLRARPHGARRGRARPRRPAPDRRGDQSGQLGRRARRLGRQAGRHQHHRRARRRRTSASRSRSTRPVP